MTRRAEPARGRRTWSSCRPGPRTREAIPSPPLRRSLDVRGVALTVLAVLACLLALQWARPVLVPILLAILISYALDPMVQGLVRWRVPHGLAASLVFIATLGVVATLGYTLSHQLAAAADRLPSAAQEFREALQTYRSGAPGAVANVQAAATELQKLSGAAAPLPPRHRPSPRSRSRKSRLTWATICGKGRSPSPRSWGTPSSSCFWRCTCC